jgi:hypothetical protein
VVSFTPRPLYLGGKAPCTRWIGVCVGSRASLDDMEKRKFLPPPGLEFRRLGLPAYNQSLYRLRYPYLEIYIENLLHPSELFYFHCDVLTGSPLYFLIVMFEAASGTSHSPLRRMEINSARVGQVSPSYVEACNVCSCNVQCKEPAVLPINHNNRNNQVNLETETINRLAKATKQPSFSERRRNHGLSV